MRFHTGATVTEVRRRDATFGVHCESGDGIEADGVVLATDVAGLRRIVDGSPGSVTTAGGPASTAMGTAPPFVVQRLWLDRPVHPGSRRRFSARAGGRRWTMSACSTATNGRRATGRRTGGSVVELHSYAVDRPHPSAVRAPAAGPACTSSIPRPRRARSSANSVLCRDDCPRFAPGDFADPPDGGHPDEGLALAGDGIRIDLPVALMERAATTGWSAANALLEHFGVAGPRPAHRADPRPFGGTALAGRTGKGAAR